MHAGLTEAQLAEVQTLQPGWTVTQTRYGEERIPVIQVENFFPDPKALIDHIRTLTFGTHNPFYPGVQAALPQNYLQPVARGVAFILREAFGFPGKMNVENLVASYVTTPPADLAPIQRYPHYDGGHDGKVALLHYLTGADQGGTRFYRHDRTGFESVRRAQDAAYGEARQADVEEYGLRAPDYFRESGHGFSHLHTAQAQPNRAVFYSSTAIHSGDLGEAPRFGITPETGRLTVNTFISPA